MIYQCLNRKIPMAEDEKPEDPPGQVISGAEIGALEKLFESGGAALVALGRNEWRQQNDGLYTAEVPVKNPAI
jgi:hypothetical protein